MWGYMMIFLKETSPTWRERQLNHNILQIETHYFNIFQHIPTTSLCQVDLYVTGFPCKAFSALRFMTEWLDDEEARQFYATASTAKTVKPRVFQLKKIFQQGFIVYPNLSKVILLENVEGIRFVLDEVEEHLCQLLPGYQLYYTILDPMLGWSKPTTTQYQSPGVLRFLGFVWGCLGWITVWPWHGEGSTSSWSPMTTCKNPSTWGKTFKPSWMSWRLISTRKPGFLGRVPSPNAFDIMICYWKFLY